jgi:cytochrome P450
MSWRALFWEHPECFDPERFMPGRAPGRPRFAYFPFGGGPRRCIGQSLAMLEMQVILAMVAQAYELRFMPGSLVEPDARLTLRPRHDVFVTLRHRRHS